MRLFLTIIISGIFFAACGGGGGGGSDEADGNLPPPAVAVATVIATNDLGMHCMDREFSVFSILPPFNVVNSQVVKRDDNGRPHIADDAEVDVFYDAEGDAGGSINSYSFGKTNFWPKYGNDLFGANLSDGEGLTGLYMPGDDPQSRGAQPMAYSPQKDWFSAEGIPITPTDDTFKANTYSLMRIIARDAINDETLGRLDVVLPVATDTDCQNCHKTGEIAADDPNSVWAHLVDKEVESKINILKLHDADQGTTLEASQPG